MSFGRQWLSGSTSSEPMIRVHFAREPGTSLRVACWHPPRTVVAARSFAGCGRTFGETKEARDETILVGTDTSAAADLAVEDAADWPATVERSSWSCTCSPTASSARWWIRRRPPTRAATWRGSRSGSPTSRRDAGRVGRPRRADLRRSRPRSSADTIVLGNRGTHGTVVAGEGQRPEPRPAARAVQRVHRGHEAGPVTGRRALRRARSRGGTRAPPSPGGGRRVPP